MLCGNAWILTLKFGIDRSLPGKWLLVEGFCLKRGESTRLAPQRRQEAAAAGTAGWGRRGRIGCGIRWGVNCGTSFFLAEIGRGGCLLSVIGYRLLAVWCGVTDSRLHIKLTVELRGARQLLATCYNPFDKARHPFASATSEGLGIATT